MTSDSSSQQQQQQQQQQGRIRKRNRITLVCNVCKFRKVKCDRGQPCNSCVKYNTAHVCAYNEPYYGEPVNQKPSDLKVEESDPATTSNPPSSSTISGGDSVNTGGTPDTSVTIPESRKPTNIQQFHANEIASIGNAEINLNESSRFDTSHNRLSRGPIFPPASFAQTDSTHQYSGTTSPAFGAQNSMSDPSLSQFRSPPVGPRSNSSTRSTGSSSISIPSDNFYKLSVHSDSTSPVVPKINQRDSSSLSTAEPINLNRFTTSSSERSHQSSTSQKTSPNDSIQNQSSATAISTGPSSVSSGSVGGRPGASTIKESVDSGANFYLVTRQYSEVMRFFKDYKSVIGVNPISSPTDTINFFDYSSISSTQDKYEVNHGPFTWPSFMKKDAGLSDLWSFMSTKSQTFSDTRNKILQSMTERNDGPVSETNRRLLSNTPIQVIQRINRSTKPKIDSAKQKEANVPVGLNLIKNDDYSSNSDLPSKILAVLPTKRIIWIHVSRFFKFIYPFIPFLDEISFKKSLESIIGLEAFTEDKVSALNIVDNHDFAVLGLMLVILRMSYLSLISNNQEINDYFIGYDGLKPSPLHQKKQRLTDSELRSLKTLLLNSIGIDFIYLARSCMNRFQIFQKMNLTILQLSLFMRIYVSIAPEDAEGPDRNQFQIYNATLFSMAYSIGLNREPTKFKDILNDEKENNIRRKIWLHLRYLDLHQAFAYGNPSLINPLNSDVKFPFEKDGNGNISFEVLDSFSLLASKFMEPVCLSLKKLTNIIMDIDHPTRISELVESLNDLEILVARELGTHISEFVDAYEEESFNDSFKKVLQLPYYIHVKFFMVSMYHHLFIHYESEGKYELSFFYLKKMLLILFEEFLPNYFKLLDQEHYYFSYSANLFLNPIIETAMHKSNGILFSLIIRMNYTIRAMEKGDPTHEDKMQLDPIYKDYFDAMKKLLYYFVKCSKIGTLGITKLGRRYLYSWRISKSHVYILKSIQSDDFYSSFDFIDYCEKDVNPEAPNCGNCNYNPKKMNVLTNFKVPVELAKELVEIMSGSMSRIDRPELVKEWVALYGPIITTAPTSDKQPESTNKRRKTSEVVFPDTNVPVQSHVQKTAPQGQSGVPLYSTQSQATHMSNLLNNDYVSPKLSPFPIEHSFDQNIDELFSRISNSKNFFDANSFNNINEVVSFPSGTTPVPSAPEIAGLNGGIQNTFDNALENYYALDDPSFGIFDDLSLDQLVESFDTD